MTDADREARRALEAVLDNPQLFERAAEKVRRGYRLDRAIAEVAGVSKGYVHKMLRKRGRSIVGKKLVGRLPFGE